MSQRTQTLAARRADLERRIAAQRAQLGAHFEVVERRLAPLALGLRGASWIVRHLRHPWVLGAGMAALFIARPRTIGKLVRGGLRAASFTSGILRIARRFDDRTEGA